MLGSEYFNLITETLRQRLSLEQIVGKLNFMEIPGSGDANVCSETIYNGIYALHYGQCSFGGALQHRKSPTLASSRFRTLILSIPANKA